jgi:hypothetical protein
MNECTSVADLYDLYVTDTRDHPFWTRRAGEAPGPILELTAGTGRATVALQAETECYDESPFATETGPFILAVLEPAHP